MAVAGQPHGSAAHRAGFAVVAALAGAVVLVLVASGSLRSAGTFAQRGALLQDDVTHDGALGAVFSGGRVSRGARGRQHRGGLSKDASMSDFFKAALDGDFSKGGTVKAATSGIFDNSRTNPGTQRALSRRESRELKAPRRAREQALAELRVKAAHAALAAEAHADRSPTCSDVRCSFRPPPCSFAVCHLVSPVCPLWQTCAPKPGGGREGSGAARGGKLQGGSDACQDQEKGAKARSEVPIRRQVCCALHRLRAER
jgi:hypothetical protein